MIPKLAYIYEPNSGQGISGLALFEIHHIDHNLLKTAALDGIWVEFQGINEIEFANKPTKADLTYNSVNPRLVDYASEHYSSADEITISPIHNSIIPQTDKSTNDNSSYSKLETFDT